MADFDTLIWSVARPAWLHVQCCYRLLVENEQVFDWDDGNTGHLARHGVSRGEAEEAILDPNAILLEIEANDEERVKAVGTTQGGRILVVVFTWRGEDIRAITAYNAPIGTQKLYLEGERV